MYERGAATRPPAQDPEDEGGARAAWYTATVDNPSIGQPDATCANASWFRSLVVEKERADAEAALAEALEEAADHRARGARRGRRYVIK